MGAAGVITAGAAVEFVLGAVLAHPDQDGPHLLFRRRRHAGVVGREGDFQIEILETGDVQIVTHRGYAGNPLAGVAADR